MNDFLFKHIDVGIISVVAEDEPQALFALRLIVEDHFPQTSIDEWNRFEGLWWINFCGGMGHG